MKVPVYDLQGKEKGEAKLPAAFSKPLRKDLIKRAVIAEQSWERQPYGADKLAGKRTSAHYHGERAIRHSMMNREMARMQRIHGSGILHMRARFAPQAVKGRKAHPPKAEKDWTLKINRKEWLFAFASALSASASVDAVRGRGHVVDGIKHMPLILDDKLESLVKTKELLEALVAAGLGNEISRCIETKIRAGRGKSRGRKAIRRKGPLIVVSEASSILRLGNIPGIDLATPESLTVSMLAPGAHPGRVTVWTPAALKKLESMTAV